MFLGQPTYLEVKTNGENSMSVRDRASPLMANQSKPNTHDIA